MTIVSQKLRNSAGHHDAYCTQNKQKTIHAAEPANLPRGRTAKQCHCGVWFELPSCHAARHSSCTATCAAQARAQERSSRERSCLKCGTAFVPRPWQLSNGIGKYCSTKCSTQVARESEAFRTARPAAIESRKRNYVPKVGPDNPRWMGGPKAAVRRRIESGKANAYTRAYRESNPEMVREWRQKRRGLGRLPRGTVARLMEAQRGKCANCKCGIRGGYHVDHVMPIARGGLHEPANIQLLCKPCNLHKSARDPIVFAQMNGRLL